MQIERVCNEEDDRSYRQTSYISTFFKVNQYVQKKELDIINGTISFRCELDAEHQTGDQYSKQDKINV